MQVDTYICFANTKSFGRIKMDTFFEQIVAIKSTAKTWLAVIGIWLLAFIIGVAALLFLGSFGILIGAGVIFGAYKLASRFSVEYEYIVTNTTLDVDKITARSSRKRELSCELPSVERLEKYNPASPPVGNYKKSIMACNPSDPDAYFIVVSEETKGTRLVVFAPDDRIKGAIVKSLPKYIANSAFKD